MGLDEGVSENCSSDGLEEEAEDEEAVWGVRREVEKLREEVARSEGEEEGREE